MSVFSIKYFKYIIFVIFLLLVVGLGAVYFTLKKSNSSVATSNNKAQVTTSESLPYDISFTERGEESLNSYLDQYQILSRGVLLKSSGSNSYLAPVEKVELIITPTVQDEYFIRGKELLATVGQTYDANSKVVTLYVNPTEYTLENFPAADLNSFISAAFIEALYYSTIFPDFDINPIELNTQTDFINFIAEYKANQNSFINLSPSLVKEKVLLLLDLTASPAFAINCSGSRYILGAAQMKYYCQGGGNNGQLCDNSEDDCDFFPCVGRYECVTTGATANCTDPGIGACVPAGLGNCDNGYCSNPGGGGTLPTPTPPGGGGGPGGTPTPTPNVGWGPCGSCSGCLPGDPRDPAQCVRAPDGSCHWDSALCGTDGPGCNVNFQTPARSLYVGQSATVTAYASGAWSDWDGTFTFNSGWGAPAPDLGEFYPNTFGTGPTFTTTFTAETVGNSYINLRVHGDNNFADQKCQGPQPVAVLACPVNCPVMCSQPNGCGGNCANTDAAVPGTPSNLQPTGNVNVASTNINLTWTAGSLADSYEVEVYPQGTSCSDPSAFCSTAVYGTSQAYTISASVNTYFFRVRSVNNTCNAILGNVTQYSPWASTTFTPMGVISGNFYLDDLLTCSSTTPVSIGSAGTMVVVDKNSNTISAAFGPGRQSFTASVPFWTPNGNNALTFTPVTDGSGNTLYCACNASDPLSSICTKTGISSPQAAVNFYVTTIPPQDAWFQVFNGLMYAGNTTGEVVRSEIPPTVLCTAPGCIPALSARNLAQTNMTDAPILTGGGNVEANGQANQRTPSTIVRGLPADSFRQGYEYFYSRYSLGTTPTDNFSGQHGSGSSSSKPTTSGAHYSNGNLRITSNWNVGVGETIVIFVNGDLRIEDPSALGNLITVQKDGTGNSGFLAFIVNGNIIIDSTVGNTSPASTATNLQGMFIADGTITIDSNGGTDKRFIGEGNFIGWSGVNLERELAVIDNRNKPAEQFIFRPEFIRVMPAEMKEPLYIWQEVNP